MYSFSLFLTSELQLVLPHLPRMGTSERHSSQKKVLWNGEQVSNGLFLLNILLIGLVSQSRSSQPHLGRSFNPSHGSWCPPCPGPPSEKGIRTETKSACMVADLSPLRPLAWGKPQQGWYQVLYCFFTLFLGPSAYLLTFRTSPILNRSSCASRS